MIRVTIWNEYRHEKLTEHVGKIYPNGMHAAIGEFLEKEEDIEVTLAALDDPDNGLPPEVLENTDVLIWWGHAWHGDVPDELVDRIYNRVLLGMGFIALHSTHLSKVFTKLMGTSCTLAWRHGARERVWCVNPSHPIAQGVPTHFELPQEEMYCEPFDIPQPEELIFIGWFNGGEVFRSGCTYTRGYGRIFYFQPGHEEYPIFYTPEVQTIIKNAVRWAKPRKMVEKLDCPCVEPLEEV